DQHEIGLFLDYHRLEAAHDRRCLLCVRSRAHLQVHVRLRYPELFEKRLRHVSVVMLAGVHQSLYDGWSLAECRHHRAHLHEVWSCTNYMENVHRSSAAPFLSASLSQISLKPIALYELDVGFYAVCCVEKSKSRRSQGPERPERKMA